MCFIWQEIDAEKTEDDLAKEIRDIVYNFIPTVKEKPMLKLWEDKRNLNQELQLWCDIFHIDIYMYLSATSLSDRLKVPWLTKFQINMTYGSGTIPDLSYRYVSPYLLCFWHEYFTLKQWFNFILFLLALIVISL